MAAVVQWARAHGKHISIFAAKHHTESGKPLYITSPARKYRYLWLLDFQLMSPGRHEGNATG